MTSKLIIRLGCLSILVLCLSACVTSTPVAKEIKSTAQPASVKPANKKPTTPAKKTVSTYRSIRISMDPVDRLKTDQALDNTTDGQATNWTNPTSGNQYTVTPIRKVEQGDDRCREYQITATIRGRYYKANQLGCRDTLGHWQ